MNRKLRRKISVPSEMYSRSAAGVPAASDMQAEEQCRRTHFWVLVAPQRHVLYRYLLRHDSEAVDRLLAGYKGHLVADAHSVTTCTKTVT
jgi:hypothetical protein